MVAKRLAQLGLRSLKEGPIHQAVALVVQQSHAKGSPEMSAHAIHALVVDFRSIFEAQPSQPLGKGLSSYPNDPTQLDPSFLQRAYPGEGPAGRSPELSHWMKKVAIRGNNKLLHQEARPVATPQAQAKAVQADVGAADVNLLLNGLLGRFAQVLRPEQPQIHFLQPPDQKFASQASAGQQLAFPFSTRGSGQALPFENPEGSAGHQSADQAASSATVSAKAATQPATEATTGGAQPAAEVERSPLDDLESQTFNQLKKRKGKRREPAEPADTQTKPKPKIQAKAKAKGKAKPTPKAKAKGKPGPKPKAKATAKKKAKGQAGALLYGCPRCRGNVKGCRTCRSPTYQGVRLHGRERWRAHMAARK